MKKLNEHSQWDEEWAKAFEDASQTPPPNVWNNIQAVQANKDADKFRKRAFYYKWLAAASVLISLCSAALLLLNSDLTNQNDGVAESSSQKEQLLVKAHGNDSATNSLAESSGSKIAEGQEQPVSDASPAGPEGAVAQKKQSTGSTKAESFEGTHNSLAQASKPAKSEGGAAQKTINGNMEEEKGSQSLPLGREEGSLADSRKANDNVTHGNAKATPGDEDSAVSSALLATNDGQQNQEEQYEGVNSLGYRSNDGGDAGSLELVSISRKDLAALLVENRDNNVEAEIRKVWVASNFVKKDKSRAVPRYMLGATLASNSFSANYQDQNPEMVSYAESTNDFQSSKLSPLSNARITDWDEEQKSEMSITGGLQAAAWLGKRWVLQGGVQYGNYKTGSKASTYTDASGNHSYPLHFANYSEEKVQTATFGRGSSTANTVSATNAFEFLSVPLSIGYVVIDRRLSLLLAPGVSSEFFLSNTLSANDGSSDLNSYTVSNGEESPFSFVHFKGLLSAQLFYRMSDNYIISLEPGYQHAISDFNKSDSFFSSRPSNLSLAAGFRFVFH